MKFSLLWGSKIAFLGLINYISHQNYQKRKFDGTWIPKKEFFDGCICDPKIILEYNFFFRNFDGTHIPKKEFFNGLHKHLKTHFGTIISFFSNFHSLYK